MISTHINVTLPYNTADWKIAFFNFTLAKKYCNEKIDNDLSNICLYKLSPSRFFKESCAINVHIIHISDRFLDYATFFL